MKLTFVRLLVDDFPACFRFYGDVMGFAPSFGDEHGGYAANRPDWGIRVGYVRDGNLIELNQPIPATEAA